MKILIISNNCFSNYQNMGKTLNQIFINYEKKELCQLYISNKLPNIDKVNSLFQITDKSIVENILFRKAAGKKIYFDSSFINCNTTPKKNNKQFRIIRNSVTMLIRNFLWKISKWNNELLEEWLENEKPDMIFFAAGDCPFMFDIAMKISKEKQIPIFTYFCDEYYAINTKDLLPISFINKLLLRKKIRQIVNISQKNIFINKYFENFYYKKFGIHGEVIMTTSKVYQCKKTHNNKNILYFGNLSLKRWKTIYLLGKIIDSKGIADVKINVYGQINNKYIIQKLNKIKSINYNGVVNQTFFINLLNENNYLLNVESLSKFNVNRIKYSTSTKIPQYLSCNKAIINISPEKSATYDYLEHNNAAFNFKSKKELIKNIEEIFDADKYNKIINNQKTLFNLNHNEVNNSNKLKTIINNLDKSDYCLLFGIIPEVYEKEVINNSKKNVEFAANNFQKNIINGFIKNNIDPLIINSIFINSYPIGYKKLFIKSFNFKYKESNNVHKNMGFINLMIIRHFFKKQSLKKELKKWSKKISFNEKIIIGYSVFNPCFEIFKYVKKYNKNIKTCIIVPDLPLLCNTDNKIYNLFNKNCNKKIHKYEMYTDYYIVLTKHMLSKLTKNEKPYLVIEGIANTEENIENNVNKNNNLNSKVIITYCGTLNEKYGIKNLIDAFNLIDNPNFKLNICGKGNCESYVIQASKKDNRIKYLGILNKKQVHNLYNISTILVNPRLNNEEYTKYSFPSKTMEYLCSGKPVVAYMLDGMPEEYREYIYIPEDDSIKKLKDKLIEVSNISQSELFKRNKELKKFLINKNEINQTKKIIEMIEGF